MRWLRRTPLAEARWIVIDCETSGLDAQRDRLLSVAAVPVRAESIALEEAYSALLHQDAPSSDENIALHGIGGEAQLAGRPAEEVLPELAAILAGGVPVAFHAAFDAEVLRRAGLPAAPGARHWLDLAALAPALFPQRAALHALDDWLAEFGIAALARHDALGDAFATAQLFLVLLAEARRQGVATAEALARLSRARRWIAP